MRIKLCDRRLGLFKETKTYPHYSMAVQYGPIWNHQGDVLYQLLSCGDCAGKRVGIHETSMDFCFDLVGLLHDLFVLSHNMIMYIHRKGRTPVVGAYT